MYKSPRRTNERLIEEESIEALQVKLASLQGVLKKERAERRIAEEEISKAREELTSIEKTLGVRK